MDKAGIYKVLLWMVAAMLAIGSTVAQNREIIENYRYYKLFEPIEPVEQLAPEPSDTVVVFKSTLSVEGLLRSMQSVASDYRATPYYGRKNILYGVEIPNITQSSAYRLGLDVNSRLSYNLFAPDPAKAERTSVGINFGTRNYLGGATASIARTLSPKWHMAADLNLRLGNDLNVEGVHTNALAVAAIASFKPDSLNSLSMALFFTPSEQATRKASYDKVFTFAGNNLYNPAWGYKNDKAVSTNIRKRLKPTLVASYNRIVTSATTLTASAAITAGVESRGGLDWFNARSPLPDNYRQLPDYAYGDIEAAELAQAWSEGDSRFTQIYFDELIARNRLLDHAAYILSDRITRTADIKVNLSATSRLNEQMLVQYGLRASYLRQRHFKRVKDMLGGKEFYDLDYFLLDDDLYGDHSYNNLKTPERLIGVGDTYSYNYVTEGYSAEIFGSMAYHTTNLEINGSLNIGTHTLSRKGFYQKELFADTSSGRSRWITTAPWSAFADVRWHIDPTHSLYAALNVAQKAPEVEDVFLQTLYNNRTIDNPTTPMLIEAELSHLLSTPKWALQTTLFLNHTANGSSVDHIFYDIASEYADVVTSNLKTLNMGIEAEAIYRPTSHWQLSAALCWGRYRYAGTPIVSVYSDTTNALIAKDKVVNASALRTGSSPALSANLKAQYYNRGWRVALKGEYHGLRYIMPTLMRRTQSVLSYSTIASRKQLLSQQRLGDAYTFDLTLSKNIYLSKFDRRIYRTAVAPRFFDKHPRARLTVLLCVNNLLGKRDMVYRAYESSRLRKHYNEAEYTVTPHNPYLLYAYPRTYSLQVKFHF